jgi:2-polyprenyl-6-methoxyphenol hydroxylase-like FAD-dependent oxidoreductase
MNMTSAEAPIDELMVFIVGAGMGGLLLGALLQKARIQYHIFERAIEVKPLGKAATSNRLSFLSV